MRRGLAASAGMLALALVIGCREAHSPSDTTRIAFTRAVGNMSKVHVMQSDGSEVRQLRQSGDVERYPAWSPDGRMLAFSRDFDSLGLHANGVFRMSDDGTQMAPVFLDRNCSNNPCTFRGVPEHPTWSPDGSRLAVHSYGHESFCAFPFGCATPTRIYTVNTDGSGIVSTNPVVDTLMLADWDPAWSPDGRTIAFHSPRAYGSLRTPGQNEDIYLMNPDGTGVVRLTRSPENETKPAWSPDGSLLAFQKYLSTGPKIFVMNADGAAVVPLTSGPGNDVEPSWSPDGRRIAFASDRDGNWEIYATNTDGTGLTRLTNDPRDDRWPAWAPR